MTSHEYAPSSSAEVPKINDVATARYLARRALRAANPEAAPRRVYDNSIRPTQSLDLGWRADAECVTKDPELFFQTLQKYVDEAKRVCATCEVKQECSTEALTYGYEFGVWGGLSEGERRAIRRKQIKNTK